MIATEVEEHPNLADDPQNFFEMSQDVLEREDVLATWHSHPVTSPNLSIDDYRFFQSWPKLFHFIIGRDEVRCYVTINGIVYGIDEEEDHPAWVST